MKSIRVTEELHQQVKMMAAMEGRTMQKMLEILLKEYNDYKLKEIKEEAM